MEAHAQPVAMLAGLLQQHGRIDQIGAKLARERQLGEFGRDAQADQQLEVFCRAAVGRAARVDDLGQLFLAIEAEGAAAVLVIRLGNRAARLDRMHEAQFRIGQQPAHQPHFGDRGDIVMGDPVVPQDTDQIGRGIRFYRVECTPAKAVHEETRSACRSVRTVQDNRFVRRKRRNYGSSVGISGQFKGPPKRLGFRQGLPCG